MQFTVESAAEQKCLALMIEIKTRLKER